MGDKQEYIKKLGSKSNHVNNYLFQSYLNDCFHSVREDISNTYEGKLDENLPNFLIVNTQDFDGNKEGFLECFNG